MKDMNMFVNISTGSLRTTVLIVDKPREANLAVWLQVTLGKYKAMFGHGFKTMTITNYLY